MPVCYWYNSTFHCDPLVWYSSGAVCLLVWIAALVGIIFFGWFGLRPRQPKYADRPATPTPTKAEEPKKKKVKEQ